MEHGAVACWISDLCQESSDAAREGLCTILDSFRPCAGGSPTHFGWRFRGFGAVIFAGHFGVSNPGKGARFMVNLSAGGFRIYELRGSTGTPGRSSRSCAALPSMNPELLSGHFRSGHAVGDFLKRDISRVIRIPMVGLLVNAEG
jgi:hypothetical protein